MDLDNSELYWTRKKKGLATEKETEEYIRSLEEKIKELEKYEKYYQAEINLLDSYIPKSLVREKIEELDSIYQQEIKQKYNGRYYHQLSYAIQILKELLQEGDDK